jgi:CID domain
MIAEDYKDSVKSATKLYEILRTRLLTSTSPLEKLPVIYVLDSILKNCKGAFISIVEADAVTWMAKVYQAIDVVQRAKLQRVWRTWNDFHLFDANAWKTMGRCFTETNALAVAGLTSTTSAPGLLYPPVAGISRNPVSCACSRNEGFVCRCCSFCDVLKLCLRLAENP